MTIQIPDPFHDKRTSHVAFKRFLISGFLISVHNFPSFRKRQHTRASSFSISFLFIFPFPCICPYRSSSELIHHLLLKNGKKKKKEKKRKENWSTIERVFLLRWTHSNIYFTLSTRSYQYCTFPLIVKCYWTKTILYY
jgi:hypothetical protein